jgi:hypothetical protein
MYALFFSVIAFSIVVILLSYIYPLIARLDSHEYYQYYRSEAWRKKRAEAFKVHGKKCAVCHGTTDLHVHHLRYTKWFQPIFGKENPKSDLAILCKDHHPKGKFSMLQIKCRRLYYLIFRY